MEIFHFPSHLSIKHLPHKAKHMAGRITALKARGMPSLLDSYMRMSFQSCNSWKELSCNHRAENALKGSSFDFELQHRRNHTRLLASIKIEAGADDQQRSLNRPDSTTTVTNGIQKVEQVLHMVGGTGEISYAKNSRIQAKGILKAKPIVEEAVKEVYSTLTPNKFVAVDLACSSGSNTFLVISEITSVVDDLSRQLGLHLPEIQIFLNDLHGNDFNNIFQSLKAYEKQVTEEKGKNFVPFYVAGLPGSFYKRLFPSKSVHFFHSSYGQMWLSQVPRGVVEGEGVPQLKKEKLYLNQFKYDFSTFLTLRSKELIFGGRMVLTISGRRDDPTSKDMAYLWGLLNEAMDAMISEGLLEDVDQYAINFPFYTPSIQELQSIIQREGSFQLERVQPFELSWDPFEENTVSDYISKGESVAKYIRAAAEFLLLPHFEKKIIDDLFSRYAKIIATHLTEKPKWLSYILVLKLRG